MDALSKLVALVMAIILVTLFPLQYLLGHQLSLAIDYAENKAEDLTNEVRDKGYIDEEMYEGFLRDLSNTGMLFDIEIEHATPKQCTEISSIDELPGISVVSANLSSLPGGKEITDSSKTIESFAVHSHTNSCYAGHRHSLSCGQYYNKWWAEYNTIRSGLGLSTYNPSITYVSGTVNKADISYDKSEYAGSWGGYDITYYLYYCSDTLAMVSYQTSGVDFGGNGTNDSICFRRSYLDINGQSASIYTEMYRYITNNVWFPGASYTTSPYSTYYMLNPNWSKAVALFNQLSFGYPESTRLQAYIDFGLDFTMLPYYAALNQSPKTYTTRYLTDPVYTCGQAQDENPICNQVVTDVIAKYPSQTVNAGSSISATIVATFLDGHTEERTGTVSNYNSNLVGTQTATLTFSGKVDNASTMGTKSCSVSVTVVPNEKACTAGLGHPNYSASLSGCPVCTAITKISASSQTFNYNGVNHELSITNTSGYAIHTAYDIDPTSAIAWQWDTGPVQPGVYPAHIYVVVPNTLTGAAEWFFVTDRTVTIRNYVYKIVPVSPTQTIYSGGSIDKNALITMADGTTETVSCTSLNISNTVLGTQAGYLIYYGDVYHLNYYGDYASCNLTVTVLENRYPVSLSVVPSAYTVYNGTVPTYTVTVNNSDSTSSVITSGYTTSGWSTGVGAKTVSFSYTEKGRTVTTSVIINVKPNLVALSATPASQSIERYKTPVFSVVATYEDGSATAVQGYSITGFNNTIIGSQNVSVSYTENDITKSCQAVVQVTPMKRTCTECGAVYNLDENDFDQGCPVCRGSVASIAVSPVHVKVSKNSSLPITVTATFQDGHTEAVSGWTSDYDASAVGIRVVNVWFQGKMGTVIVDVIENKTCAVCGTEYSLNEDGTDPGCPVCSGYIVSISASPVTQTISQGELLSLTVTGQYRDGHSRVLTEWSSDFNPDLPGTQQVIVYYASLTCRVSVTVKPVNEIACSICGTTYNTYENPWGCPICSGTVVGIDAALKNGGTRTPLGESLNLRVVLTYRDRHRAMIYGGWTDNFRTDLLGVQTVTVSYTDTYGNVVSTHLSVEVVNRSNPSVCINGHQYYPTNEGDPCPYCEAWTKHEKESIYNSVYTNEILTQLYQNGVYYFKQGDYVSIKVKISLKGGFYSFNLFGKKKEEVNMTYGGEIT